MKEQGLSFAEALEAVARRGVFTTHTPVPAGIDVFPPELVDRYFGGWLREVGVARDELLALGRPDGADDNDEPFNMAALALRTSAFAQRGEPAPRGGLPPAARRLLSRGSPSTRCRSATSPTASTPAAASPGDMAGLFDRYLVSDWSRRPGVAETWEASRHDSRRGAVGAPTSGDANASSSSPGAAWPASSSSAGPPPATSTGPAACSNPRALTIGFARRFATYKRADLILHDIDRLKTHPARLRAARAGDLRRQGPPEGHARARRS